MHIDFVVMISQPAQGFKTTLLTPVGIINILA